jgi:hypothetical protein
LEKPRVPTDILGTIVLTVDIDLEVIVIMGDAWSRNEGGWENPKGGLEPSKVCTCSNPEMKCYCGAPMYEKKEKIIKKRLKDGEHN